MHVNPAIKYLAAFIILSALSLSLLFFFSQPNRLNHDQITHRWYLMANENPKTFQGDYLLDGQKYKLEDNYFAYNFYKFLGRQIDPAWPEGGGDELARWMLLPIVFLVFSFGMYTLLYYFTNNFWISLPVALLANIHVSPVFVAEWGLPGPTGLDPWTFVLAFYPLLFLSFYRGLKENREFLVFVSFAATGLLGNVHLISTFYLIGAFALTYLYFKKISLSSLVRLAEYGSTSVLLSIPFLWKHFSAGATHITAFDPSDLVSWQMIQATAQHVTLSGRLVTLRYWLVDQWYITLVGFALLVMVTLYYKKYADGREFFSKFSWIFAIAAMLFNAAFSALQIFNLYFLDRLAMFNEPRGVQFIYILFFISLSLILDAVWTRLAPLARLRKKTLGIVLFILAAVSAVTLIPRVIALSKAQTKQRFTFLTCDSELYRRLSFMHKPGETILVDPGAFSAIRICAASPVVVQSRDRGPAYDQGSDVLLEWYKRYTEVSKAYEKGGATLANTAKKYQARVIISRQCIPVPHVQLAEWQTVKHPTLQYEGCIYVLKDAEPQS